MKHEMATAFIDALYFADTGEEGQPDSFASLSLELRGRIDSDVDKFCKLAEANPAAYAAIEGSPESAGHDFYFTRQGHGAGFWDGDWPADIGEFLTECCEQLGALEIYQGDDGLIYA